MNIEENKGSLSIILHSNLKELSRLKNSINDLVNVEELINKGDYKDALMLLERIEKESKSNLLNIHIIMGALLNKMGKFNESLIYGKMAFSEASKFNKSSGMADSLMSIAYSLVWLGNYQKSLETLIESEILINSSKIGAIEEKERRLARANYIRAGAYFFLGDTSQSMIYAKKSLQIREKYSNKSEIAESLFMISYIYTHRKVALDSAITYSERAQLLAEESHNFEIIALNLFNLGALYSIKGEYGKAIMYNLKCLPIFEKMGNLNMITSTHGNIAFIRHHQGFIEESFDHLKIAIDLARQIGNTFLLVPPLLNMADFYILNGDLITAEDYLEEVRLLSEKNNNKIVKQMYLVEKAFFLWVHPSIEKQLEAEQILKQLLNDDVLKSDTLIITLLLLSNILIHKLKITNEVEILEEVNPIIKKLLNICEYSNSFWTLAETYTLQAKLSLLMFDFKESRRLLTHAQEIAEEQGMRLLAKKISTEHDNILNQINELKGINAENIPINDRITLFQLEDQLEGMIKKSGVHIDEIEDENPVILLFLTEGGIPIFSHIFSEEWGFENDTFGGFLSAINSFSEEIFSKGLDRAIFGDHMIIMKPLNTFSVCYLFKGQSYNAIKRVNQFISRIQNNSEIWNELDISKKSSKTVEINKIPQLKDLIEEMFI